MRPGQLKPNEFERAILDLLVVQSPEIGESLESLHVFSREFTGVGSFTNFSCGESDVGMLKRRIGLNASIHMPAVPNGMGALLFCKGDQPACREIYTYGNEHWDGVYVGFTIEEAAK